MDIADKLKKKLQHRLASDSLRSLPDYSHFSSENDDNRLVDFSSNDYLGFAQSERIFKEAHQYLLENKLMFNGATGSRLISGNHPLYKVLESKLSSIHLCPAALIFNSGYDANLGLLSAVPLRQDIVLYDKLCHASIRDGMQLSQAKSYGFAHNDLLDLETKLRRFSKLSNQPNQAEQVIYVVTESVFSMDGDSPDLEHLINLCEQYNANLIIDEAHALGVYPLGLLQHLGLHEHVFARIMTFGKALGCHGAVILGNDDLIEYLINFSRPFIYTTGLSPHSLATILVAYDWLIKMPSNELRNNIDYFTKLVQELELSRLFITSTSAIQSCLISDNSLVKEIADKLNDEGFDVKAILSPTVKEGEQRLRFCLHSYNNKTEIERLLKLLADNVTC